MSWTLPSLFCLRKRPSPCVHALLKQSLTAQALHVGSSACSAARWLARARVAVQAPDL